MVFSHVFFTAFSGTRFPLSRMDGININGFDLNVETLLADFLLEDSLLSCQNLRIFRKHKNILFRVFRLLETIFSLLISFKGKTS